MAKDDYYVIVAKILVYLYARLKGKNKTKPEEFLHSMSNDFPIDEAYFNYVLDEMQSHGYIRLTIIKAWGGEIVMRDLSTIQITQEGIEYLSENSKIKKVINLIPMASTIFELFQ